MIWEKDNPEFTDGAVSKLFKKGLEEYADNPQEFMRNYFNTPDSRRMLTDF